MFCAKTSIACVDTVCQWDINFVYLKDIAFYLDFDTLQRASSFGLNCSFNLRSLRVSVFEMTERYRRELLDCKKKPGNNVCADCGAPGM